MIMHTGRSNMTTEFRIGLIFDALWLVVFSLIEFIYVSMTQPIFRHVSPWLLWLIVVPFPVLLIQGVSYGFLRKKFARNNSILRTIVMSFLVFIGFLVVVGLSFNAD